MTCANVAYVASGSTDDWCPKRSDTLGAFVISGGDHADLRNTEAPH